MRTTPSAVELRAAQQEAAALREAERAAKLKRARALLAKGLGPKAVSRRLHLSPRVVRELAGGA